MTKLAKNYIPKEYEDQIYSQWEKSGAFAPRGEGNSFSLAIPPPNANGNLHIGHALTLGLEDIIIRFHRLKGDRTLFLPGADHAGFETWVVYEKQLAKEGKSRFDFSREELYANVWDFVAKNRKNFESQMRKLGLSLDWDRFTYSLDPNIVSQAYATFKKMWDEHLIYRGERLVNFCTFHGTAFADIEVAYKEEKGKLWHISYPLTDGSGHMVVATTRPETMLGDTAVAVHPEDKRYKKFIGKTVRLPLTNREVPIIADEFVDPAFGTGAVKVTPAHDPNDYEAGKRHNLPMITVINHLGNITDEMPITYRGLSVKLARDKVAHDLEEQGNIVKVEDIAHNVGHCYKCHTVIEPLLREQWFIDMQPLAKEAIKVLENKEIKFYPQSKRNQLIEYLKNLRDWNISRQIAWGIPIPAFQNVDNPDDWIYDERTDKEIITAGNKTYHRDPDVFDTWFSSSSWPYATLNFPNGEDYKDFYPLDVMETGGEILYPWVSRMIMLGLYVTGKIPFKTVYVHGYVMAEDGSKMSKSIGNVIDPIEVIDKYGSDALRMGIVAGRSPAVNRGYDSRRVEDARNFCNKLWNVARFIEATVEKEIKTSHEPTAESIADHWIMNKLQLVNVTITDDLENYRFAEAYENLYHFVWDDLADWYIETSKSQKNSPLLRFVLESVLKLAHPFAPFVTEAIWQSLAWQPGTFLINSSWPETKTCDVDKSQQFEEVKTIVSEIRNLISLLNIKTPTVILADEPLLKDNSNLIKKLAKVEFTKAISDDGEGLKLTQTKHNVWLDIDKAKISEYLDKLEESKTTQTRLKDQLNSRLNNEQYLENAPAKIVYETRLQLTEVTATLVSINQQLQRFTTQRKNQ